MALIECPECGHKLSTFAPTCPGCGAPKEIIQRMLANIVSLVPSNEEENINTGSKNSNLIEATVRPFTTILIISESHTPRIKLKSVHCAVCNNTYQAEEKVCPKCKYPLWSICYNEETRLKGVKEYRKEAGVEIAATIKKRTAIKKKVNLQVEMGCYQGEEINWRVLAVEEGKVLLISEKGLDVKPYNKEFKAITWEKCTLRKWLNSDFLNASFTTEEKERILETQVTEEKNPRYDTDPGKNTVDKLFLLSIQEADKYFKDDDDRKTYPTEFAKNKGAYVDDSTKCCWWWLRSPGDISDSATDVVSEGWFNDSGSFVNAADVCVRPALWVKL